MYCFSEKQPTFIGPSHGIRNMEQQNPAFAAEVLISVGNPYKNELCQASDPAVSDCRDGAFPLSNFGWFFVFEEKYQKIKLNIFKIKFCFLKNWVELIK